MGLGRDKTETATLDNIGWRQILKSSCFAPSLEREEEDTDSRLTKIPSGLVGYVTVESREVIKFFFNILIF